MKSIIVTGASSGIGQATALGFLEAGWRVGLLARRAEPLQKMEQEFENAVALPADVTDEAAVDAAFQKFCANGPCLDVLFNNAGLGVVSQTIDEIAFSDWKNMVDVNLTGMFLCARAAFRHMRAQTPQGGRIINNGSISAHVPRPGSTCYTATKHGVLGLTKTLALDGRPFNIACGQIDIGNTASDMTQAMSSGVPQADGTMKPEPVMSVENVVRAVQHMASLPAEANVLTMTVMASAMPYVGRG